MQTSQISDDPMHADHYNMEGVAIEDLRTVVADLLEALRFTLKHDRACAELRIDRAQLLLRAGPDVMLPEDSPPATTLSPGLARRVAAHIQTNLATPLRIEAMAQFAGLSLCHFSRAFRSTFGIPPHVYLMRRRIEAAQGLMLSTPLSLAQIAFDTGHADQAHFCKLFKRVVGETPSAWRRARSTAIQAPAGIART